MAREQPSVLPQDADVAGLGNALPEQLAKRATEARLRDLRMVYEAGLGHLGGEFSAIDILTTLYFGVLRIDPARPDDPERDRFILSKGHAAAALYVTLAEAGFFDPAELVHVPGAAVAPERPPRPTQGARRRDEHRAARATASRSRSASPWRHGSTAPLRRTFVLCGDGELQEGSMWEAAMAAGHFGLDGLTLIVDRNGLQQGDATERRCASSRSRTA